MIVIGSGIDETIVDNACRSLDIEVKTRSREEDLGGTSMYERDAQCR
jgi:hypothetical protein